MTNFSAAAFELTAAINLRLALRLVKPTAECLARAEEVYERTKLYGELREAGSGSTVNAERQLANALEMLTAEMHAASASVEAFINSDDHLGSGSRAGPKSDAQVVVHGLNATI
ncbi:hypothetical protein AM571_PC01137 (plasmid) [Rhizobium etli 8C-3]|uniref:Uncharacterized protein n=1 Tax=Rhizobium etli 8C-3 TaxID=538025 RepID=A0A1L5PFN4_RHIET|nr:hypothetical protein AM571_PC01137 [Rhizobium etli 8C-3]